MYYILKLVFLFLFLTGCSSSGPSLGKVYKAQKWCENVNNKKICSNKANILPLVSNNSSLLNIATSGLKVNGKKVEIINDYVNLITLDESKDFGKYYLNSESVYLNIAMTSSTNKYINMHDTIKISNGKDAVATTSFYKEQTGKNVVSSLFKLNKQSRDILKSENASILVGLSNGTTRTIDIGNSDAAGKIAYFYKDIERKEMVKAQKIREQEVQKELEKQKQLKAKIRIENEKKLEEQRKIDKKISEHFTEEDELKPVKKVKVDIKIDNTDIDFFNSLNNEDTKTINLEK